MIVLIAREMRKSQQSAWLPAEARAYRHLLECGVELREATDHWIAESLYFDDPDGNQVEIYWERPPEYWFEADGQIRSQLKPLDLTSLLAELNEPEPSG